MPKYIALLNWTEQGIKAVKNSPARFDAARDMATQAGCKLETIYMTFGRYDQVAIIDAPGDEEMATLSLRLASLGNVHMQTMRAFVEDEYRRITGSV
jgi:uncharacterized protein with GYD domain